MTDDSVRESTRVPPPLSPLRSWHFLLFAVVYLYSFPYFDLLRSAQEMPRLLLTQEIVDHGTLALDRRLGELGSRNDLSIGPDRHTYANKSPGPSFVAIPFYLLAKMLGLTSIRACMWAFRVGAITLPSLLFLPIFYRLAGRFSKDERARRAALAAYAIGSPVLVYAQLLLAHQLAAVCLGTAFYLCVRLVEGDVRRPLLAVAAAGFCAGLAPAMDYQATLAAPLIGAYLLVRVPGQRWRRIALFGLAALPGLVGLAAYHAACFGSPFKISYAYGLDRAPEKGALGFIGPNAQALYNILLAPSNGLLVLLPWVLLAVVGAIVLFRDSERRIRVGAEAATCAAVALVYLLFVGSMLPYMARGGWSVGPRQLVASLPFLGWLAVAGFEVAGRRIGTTVVTSGLVLASTVIFLLAATTFPHWPDGLANPLYELAIPLLRQGHSVTSLGTALGLRGFLAAAPLYLLTVGLAVWLLVGHSRRPVATALLSLLLAAGIVTGHRFFPKTGPYAQRALHFATDIAEPSLRR